MKVISLWQPWASLWANGLKRIETRSWPYRGRLPVVLAVHAAKRFPPELRLLCEKEPFHAALRAAGWYGARIPLGVVVGLVRLVECRSTGTGNWDDAWVAALTAQERAFGDYSPGRFGWVCDSFGPLTPIPLRGMQGVFSWDAPPEIEDAAAILLKDHIPALESGTP